MDRFVQRSNSSCVINVQKCLEIIFYIQECTKNWLWSDNSQLDYTDFISGQPDCYQNMERCVQIVYANSDSGQAIGWNDLNCDKTLKPICMLT